MTSDHEKEEWRKEYLADLAEYKDHYLYFKKISKIYVLSDSKTHDLCLETLRGLKQIQKDLIHDYQTRFGHPISKSLYPRVEDSVKEPEKQTRDIFN